MFYQDIRTPEIIPRRKKTSGSDSDRQNSTNRSNRHNKAQPPVSIIYFAKENSPIEPKCWAEMSVIENPQERKN